MSQYSSLLPHKNFLFRSFLYIFITSLSKNSIDGRELINSTPMEKTLSIIYCNFILGSNQLYRISTSMLIKVNKVAITRTLPITTGKSNVFSAVTISFPKPFQLKMYATMTATANMEPPRNRSYNWIQCIF